jgi:hypothetical protein
MGADQALHPMAAGVGMTIVDWRFAGSARLPFVALKVVGSTRWPIKGEIALKSS